MLHECFSRLSVEYRQNHCSNFDQYRDQLRDILSARQPNTFPRHGPAAIDVADIFEQLNENGQQVTIQHICPHCNQTPPLTISLPLLTTVHPSMLSNSPNHQVTMPTPFTIQEWVNALITTNADSHLPGTTCPACSTTMQITNTVLQPSPFLHFEVPPEVTNSVLPSHILTVSKTISVSDHYLLRGIIYHGQLHFTARLITTENIAWAYDGQLNRGVPVKDHSMSDDIHQLTTFQGRQAYIYVYQHIPHPPPPT
jgi:hypothetical protein